MLFSKIRLDEVSVFVVIVSRHESNRVGRARVSHASVVVRFIVRSALQGVMRARSPTPRDHLRPPFSSSGADSASSRGSIKVFQVGSFVKATAAPKTCRQEKPIERPEDQDKKHALKDP